MSNFKKTFVNEYHLGSKVVLQRENNALFVTFGDDDAIFSCVLPSSPFWKTDLRIFLEENTSHYYAEKLEDFILNKISDY